ncbi:hypothetical protein T552_02821 [Pneumocystis carinii B80]|uniref:Carboxypeptidase n=1 Tax=Pneumocystis carinii (strain B80) TaxID=1408658 RepID=A0A0W4ZD54_PNEC8|nr:hypothetical protein T552_02821 [Pneumocystis carinii B80]KTW26336.1 hypothetical protein T552_02821 [Pneumocystis carinii B80]
MEKGILQGKKLLLVLFCIIFAGLSGVNTIETVEKIERVERGEPEYYEELNEGISKYSNAKMIKLIDMLSGFTKDANDIQKWAEEYYSSIFHDEEVDIRMVAKEYVETKLSLLNEWKVIEKKSIPEYKLHVRKVNDPILDVVTQYSGYIQFQKRYLYYYFLESRSDPMKDPLILWLNGGPGCSSFFGMFFALGPSKYDLEDGSIYYNPWSWNHRSSLIFLDQPAGAGFSYNEDDKDISLLAESSWNFYIFMVLFFTAFPQYSHLDFHLAGESYAGHFIPIFAAEIMEYKHKPLDLSDIPEKIDKFPDINLKTVMIGNGYVDPYNQFAYFYYVGCSKLWGGLLPSSVCDTMRGYVDKCLNFLEFCLDYMESECTCSSSIRYCNIHLLEPFITAGIDLYDRRLKFSTVENQFANFIKFVNDKKVFFNATSRYSLCNYNITMAFLKKGEQAQSVVPFVKSLLDDNIKVLVFAGDQDIICNWYGVSSWVHEMKWNHTEEFNNQSFRPWSLKRKLGNKLKGTIAGQVKHHSGLTLLRVRDAGHSVGETQPEYNFEMYLRWLSGDYAFEN